MTTIKLIRRWLTDRSAIGELSFGDFACYSLEDPPRTVKIPGRTGIPAGTYPVRITWSPRFKREMPIVAPVPGFEGIRVHSGNWPEDTEGCLLLGLKRGEDCILQSREAVAEFEVYLRAALAIGPVQIEIREEVA